MAVVAALFTQSGGDPATGLALVDIDLYLWSRHKITGAIAVVWTGVNPTEEVGGGLYSRNYSPNDDYDYFGMGQYTGVAVLDSDYSLQSCPAVDALTAAEVWSYARRTLTVDWAHVTTSLQRNVLDLLRGDTLEINVTMLGDLTARTELWFTVKDDKDKSDTGAFIQISETAGLLYIVGAPAAVPANGSLVVTDAVNGNLTITLAAVESVKLSLVGRCQYDIQMLDNTGVVNTLSMGKVNVIGDVTRVIS